MKKIIFIVFFIPFFNFSQTFEKDLEEPLTNYNDASNDADFVEGTKIKQIDIVHYGGGGLSKFDELDSIGKDSHVMRKITLQYNKNGKTVSFEKDYILFKESKKFEYDNLNRLVKIIYSKWNREIKEYEQNEVFEHHDNVVKRHQYYKNDLEEISCSAQYYFNENNFLSEIKDHDTCFHFYPLTTYKYDENGNVSFVDDTEMKYVYDKHNNLLSSGSFEAGSKTPSVSSKSTYNDQQQLIDYRTFYEEKLDERYEYEYENDLLSKKIVYLKNKKDHYFLYYYDTKGNWIRKERYLYPESYVGVEEVWLVDISIRNIQYW
ncbi:MAG: hypothetical protein AB8B65_13290 [Kordia sp.]|uniref:hypothetical protein n=1 Tax=Kordia sp. TaxID=1965332 RepID=UPI0038585739